MSYVFKIIDLEYNFYSIFQDRVDLNTAIDLS